MTPKEKIDYMIQSLQLAKEEIEYAEEYFKRESGIKDFYNYSYVRHGRIPNGTVIRESLKQVGRMANIVANDVVLSPYCHQLFR